MKIAESNMVDGKGLFATESVNNGGIVFTLSGEIFDRYGESFYSEWRNGKW